MNGEFIIFVAVLYFISLLFAGIINEQIFSSKDENKIIVMTIVWPLELIMGIIAFIFCVYKYTIEVAKDLREYVRRQ